MTGKHIPHPVDVYVGSRIRLGRWARCLSQAQLGMAVGIKFQQIQKYECGANRVSASRLHDIAKALDFPVTYFFEGADKAIDDKALPPSPPNRATVRMTEIFPALPAHQQAALLKLAESMGKAQGLEAAA